MQAIGQLGQSHHLCAKLGGQFFAAVHAAIGNGHAAWVFGGEVCHHQFDHFAGTHKQHFDFGQVFKQLTGQTHSRRRHADGVRANLGGGPHFLGHGKAALKQLIERTAQRAGLFGCANGVFELTQNLSLAQNHGVQPAGHPECVPGHMAFF